MFDPVLLGIAPSIPSCKNLCHCRGIMPSAVPSLALLVRTPIPITRNAGMSARVMKVSLRSFVVGRSSLVVGRWSLAEDRCCAVPGLGENPKETWRLVPSLPICACFAVKPPWPTTNDQRPTTNDGSLDFHHFFFLRLAHVFHLLDF